MLGIICTRECMAVVCRCLRNEQKTDKTVCSTEGVKAKIEEQI